MKSPFTRQGPVRWLALSVLARTALPVYFSGLFARYSDRRESEGVRPQHVVYTAPGDELWVDYVADTGDGLDAAATVASLLAPETLTVGGSATQAGELLVLGGDEVYPVASMREYANRFIGPFKAILPYSKPGRTVVALPGNHDWYDGLSAFLQVFCSGQWIGGWKTVQSRSYFACQLPNHWWLWAIDIQFDTYIDQPQLDYFRSMAAKLAAGDALILCWAVPSWLDKDPADTPADLGFDADSPKIRNSYETLDWFERTVVPEGVNIRVSLTGDSHHYARYESQDGAQKITAGLGGAFLSGTHHLPDRLEKRAWVRDLVTREAVVPAEVPIYFDRVITYPTAQESDGLRWSVLPRIYANDGFALLPALLYMGLGTALTRPMVAMGTGAALVGGCVAFSKPADRSKYWPGALHGLAHVAVGLGAAWGIGKRFHSSRLTMIGAGVVGAAVGPLVFGTYLAVVDKFLRMNTNELFAAQAITDYKGFLRLHFEPGGDLVIYPIKVDKVPRWVESPSLHPDTEPVVSLIEPEIRVTRTP